MRTLRRREDALRVAGGPLGPGCRHSLRRTESPEFSYRSLWVTLVIHRGIVPVRACRDAFRSPNQSRPDGP
jgi:hypothetical protein